MTKIKHFREVTLTSGKTKYAFNPSKTIRDKLGYSYKRSSDRTEILNLALEANDALKMLKNNQAVATRNNNISFDDLVDAYKRSSKWRKLKPNSQRAYSSSIRAAKLELGDINVANIKTIDADALYAKIVEASSLSNAYAIITVLSNLWSNAQRLELLSKNPFEDVELTEPPARSVKWTEQQIHQFVDAADACGKSNIGTLALLAYELCQRPIDCRLLTWSNFQNGNFILSQSKTGSGVNIPATDMLTARLNKMYSGSNMDPDALIIVCESTGKPYSERLYRKHASKIRELAGLPEELKLSDLRRSGASLLGDAGCTEDEIRSVTGHKSRQVVSTYVVRSDVMASRAQEKRQAYREVVNG